MLHIVKLAFLMINWKMWCFDCCSDCLHYDTTVFFSKLDFYNVRQNKIKQNQHACNKKNILFFEEQNHATRTRKLKGRVMLVSLSRSIAVANDFALPIIVQVRFTNGEAWVRFSFSIQDDDLILLRFIKMEF